MSFGFSLFALHTSGFTALVFAFMHSTCILLRVSGEFGDPQRWYYYAPFAVLSSLYVLMLLFFSNALTTMRCIYESGGGARGNDSGDG